ncbi:MAG TPA: response regulator transcription factor [Anaerolineae bacterium]
MPDKMHVVIIDDHPLFREGVAQTLSSAADIEVVAQGGSAETAVSLTSDLLPDILLLDIDIPGGGLGAAQAVAARCPVTKIVMLTVSEEEENLLAALRAGVRAYVLKGVSGRELIGILRGVAAGEVYVTPALAAGLLREISGANTGLRPAANPLDDLTEREHEILKRVADGSSNKEIGQQLHLSEKTVKYHMTNILQKLQVRNRVEAALLAQRSGQRPGKGA